MSTSKEPGQPQEGRHHDVLLVRNAGYGQPPRLDRFLVDKDGDYKNDNGEKKKPVRFTGEGYRPTVDFAGAGDGTPEDPKRGPVFSTLPLNPSPAASSSCTCYLINPENLNYVTAWTAEEWNDRPLGFDAPAKDGSDTFAVLIASPAGRVYYLEKKNPDTIDPVDTPDLVFKEVSLQKEPEIWTQLREGCVVGRVLYTQSPRASRKEKVVPLVNIHSLMPPEDSHVEPSTITER